MSSLSANLRGLCSLLLFDIREIRRRYQVASFSFRVAQDSIRSPQFPFSLYRVFHRPFVRLISLRNTKTTQLGCSLLKTCPTSYRRPSDSVSPTSLRHDRVHWKFSLLSRYGLSVTDRQVQSRSFIQESSFSIGVFVTLPYCAFEGFSLFASFSCTLLKPYRSSCFLDIDANVTYLLEDKCTKLF